MEQQEKQQRLSEAIINDVVLKRLRVERMRVAWYSKPAAMLNSEAGELTLVDMADINIANHIDRLIEERENQIKAQYE